ncbi:hypothetical protein [Coleofasciculus sp. H7-2]|uniref:hypothetical protein n=1 Tax=Coleofasciculus sp. H7-2 TaxID=3351545 RepID=UPI003671E3E3
MPLRNALLLELSDPIPFQSCLIEDFVTTQVKEAFKTPPQVDVCFLLLLGYAADEPVKHDQDLRNITTSGGQPQGDCPYKTLYV